MNRLTRSFQLQSLLQVLVVPLAASSLWLAGCSSEPTNPNLVPVAGTVTLDKQPLVDASITFIPLGTTAGQGGTGRTGPDGKYELMHFREGNGVDPGEYMVVVSKMVQRDGSPIPAGTLSAAEMDIREMIPRKFSDYNGSTLKTTVVVGNLPHDFQLTSR
jgi:hypothetical protein